MRTKRLCPYGTYGAYGTYGTYATYATYATYGIYSTIGTNKETKLVVKKELTKKNSVATHEGGLGQDDPENKQKVKEAYEAAAKILD